MGIIFYNPNSLIDKLTLRMKFFAIAALLATASAIKLTGPATSEATPSAAAGPVDSSGAGKKQHAQAIIDQKVTGFHAADSAAVWKAASASKNGPISTQPIPTPAAGSLPIHNKGKAGNGDTITALAQNPAWNCKCMGTTCVDHEGAQCNTHQQPAHGGQTCLGNKGKCNF